MEHPRYTLALMSFGNNAMPVQHYLDFDNLDQAISAYQQQKNTFIKHHPSCEYQETNGRSELLRQITFDVNHTPIASIGLYEPQLVK